MIGHTIEGKYRLDAQLGTGGMGTVYRAARLLIGDTVAVKILHPELVKDAQAAERFRREAQAAARLKHPNVVTVYDFGITGEGLVYLVMELIEGESLRAIIKGNGALPVASAAEITRQICAALDEAHEAHIVHRDMKPDNVIVRQTPQGLRVKVLDFGIAKLRDIAPAASNLTQTGTVLGTPFYMSPEQCMGEEIDHRADIYSVGVILYEMLVGAVPFNSPTPTAVAVQHATQQPTPPRAINISIPSGVEAVVLHALQKRREARPQTAGALAQELTDEINDMTQARHAPAMPSAQQAPPLPTSSLNSGTMPTVVMSNSAWQSGAMPPVGSTSPHYQNATSGNSKRGLLLVGGGLVLGLVVAFAAFMLWGATKKEKDAANSKNISADVGNTGEGKAVTQNTARINSPARLATPASPAAQPTRNPVDLSLVRGDVVTALEGWAAATRDHDLDLHMTYYADNLSTYYNHNNVSSAYVRSNRAPAYTRYYKLDVQLSNIVVSSDPSGMGATATFDKTWNFEGEKNSSGEVHQMIWLLKVNGRWLITGEKDLKIIYVNR